MEVVELKINYDNEKAIESEHKSDSPQRKSDENINLGIESKCMQENKFVEIGIQTSEKLIMEEKIIE